MDFNSNSASLQPTLLLQKEVIQNIELEIILFIGKYTLSHTSKLLNQSHPHTDGRETEIQLSYLAHNNSVIIRKFIIRNLQVERSRALSYSS